MKRNAVISRINFRALCLSGAAVLLTSLGATAAVQAQTENKAIVVIGLILIFLFFAWFASH